MIKKIKKNIDKNLKRPDTQPSVADGWAGVEMQLIMF